MTGMTPSKPEPSRLVQPGHFEAKNHFYPRVMNAQIHSLVRYFMDLGNKRIAERYCHLHPEADPQAVRTALERTTRFFRWGGADLLHTTTEDGMRSIMVIETNSCPSGQKSMPLLHEREEQSGYRVLLEKAFLPLLSSRSLPRGDLAVVYDKNPMEASGYASVLADATGQPVHLVACYADTPDLDIRFTEDGVMEVRAGDGWHPVRAALRYVTQRPWDRIPPLTRTLVFNPVLTCLAGGRNKLVASKAYDLFNAEIQPSGLAINSPETIWDVRKEEVPLWVARMGGIAVVKNPYSNAGQGVYTVVDADELQAFMDLEHRYDRFIVQALVGNAGWSSRGRGGRLYHVGTMPNAHGKIFAADVRFMVGSGPDGFVPVAIYARRAREPLASEIVPGRTSSWDMLGTNLSFRRPDGAWDTETDRLLLMDSRDFNRLGIGLDNLIEAYLQAVLAVSAIDRMAEELVTKKGRFRKKRFTAINPDKNLLEEITQ